jgi:hypothetical protein
VNFCPGITIAAADFRSPGPVFGIAVSDNKNFFVIRNAAEEEAQIRVPGLPDLRVRARVEPPGHLPWMPGMWLWVGDLIAVPVVMGAVAE